MHKSYIYIYIYIYIYVYIHLISFYTVDEGICCHVCTCMYVHIGSTYASIVPALESAHGVNNFFPRSSSTVFGPPPC